MDKKSLGWKKIRRVHLPQTYQWDTRRAEAQGPQGCSLELILQALSVVFRAGPSSPKQPALGDG